MPDDDRDHRTAHDSPAAVLAGVHEVLAAAARRLRSDGARDEALAEFVPEHRRLLIPRRAKMVPLGRVWRLGVFLLGHDGVLYETGSVTRASDPKYPGYQSVSAEARRSYRAAAFEGPFAPGETINFDARVIPLDEESLSVSPGLLFLGEAGAMVRWNAGGAAVGFREYVAERVDLLVRPPEGA
jgi:hypothetical protein